MKKFFKILLLTMSVFSLSGCSELINAEEIKNKLIPNLGSFLTQLSALIVLIIVVIVFGYKPIKKMVNKRQEYIANEIKEAKEKNQEASNNLAQSNETVLANRRMASEIIDNAKIEAENQKQEILRSAEIEVADMKKRAEREIKQSEEDAKEAIRQKMVEIALDASSELLKRNVNDKDNEKLVDEFIKEIDED